MSTKSDALGLLQNPEGSLQPAVAINANADAVGQLLAGAVTRDLTSDANYTLVAADYQAGVLTLTSSALTAGRDIIFPAYFPPMLVLNETGQTLTLKKSGQTGVAVTDGDSIRVNCGATDVLGSTTGGGGGDAADVAYDNATSGLAATDVQAAIDEIATASGGTNLGWFDVTAYGATGDGVTDDTTAIQDAIDAAEAAGGGVVYFPAGVYVVGGALQDTGRSNAQLLLPLLDAVDTEQITIEFRGAFAPPAVFSVIGSTPLPDGHSVIKGTLNAGSGGALLGAQGPVGTFGTFTNVHFRCRDLTFRLPSNPVLSALNLSSVAIADLDNVIVDCGSYYVQGFTEPTTTTSYAIRMPANNNGALSRLGTVNVAGFYNGYQFAEHCNGYGCQAAWGCKQAFVFATATNHASVFQRLMAVHCEKVVVATGAHYADIAQLNIEHATSGWWVTDYDIDDGSHYLQGSVTWHVVLAGTGVDSTFTVNGAAKLNIARIGYTNRVEQVSVSAAITFEGKHANKHIYHPSADTTARTWTIPANSSVPYPIGTTLTFVNDNGAGALTIAITTDTLRLAGAGTTGSRTLAANGVATAVKMTSTSWQINGSGLT